MEHGEVTLGEVYRVCQEIKKLAEKTNGRVDALETDVAVLKDRGSRDNAARATGIVSLLGSVASALWK